jgi:hypothetical protein
MGLIACPDCANQVSTLAPSCPKCGRPMGSQPIPAGAPPSNPIPEKEETLWKGTPSQLSRLGAHALGGGLTLVLAAGGFAFPALFGVALIPLAFVAWTWIEVSSTIFELTTERIRVTRGILSRKTDDLELYRIKDHVLLRPLWLRLLGLATIELESSDRTTPKLQIPAIRQAESVRETIRQCVELRRQQRGVREFDTN